MSNRGSIASSVLWRRIDMPGHEAARVVQRESSWELAGTAVFLHEAAACRLSYSVVCDVGWRTVLASVRGWVGEREIEVAISVDTDGRWWMNESHVAAVDGCHDVDLNFSPSTNLLPIRRLKLDVGQSADVRAAWLRFPGFTLEPFEQTYQRLGPSTYRYESAGGFAADLEVDAAGMVLRYGDVWRGEPAG